MLAIHFNHAAVKLSCLYSVARIRGHPRVQNAGHVLATACDFPHSGAPESDLSLSRKLQCEQNILDHTVGISGRDYGASSRFRLGSQYEMKIIYSAYSY